MFNSIRSGLFGGAAGGGGKPPPKPTRLSTDITNEMNDIETEQRKLVKELKSLQGRSNDPDPAIAARILQIRAELNTLKQRKLYLIEHFPDRD